MTGVYEERIRVLTERRAEVQSERDSCAERRAALIREGKPTGDLWQVINAHERELLELDRELSDLRNLASDKWAGDRLRADGEVFDAANAALVAKREGLAGARDDALRAVAEAADRLRAYVCELDGMEKGQAVKAAELNRAAQALGLPADFTVPAEGSVPVTGSRAAGIALSRVVQMAKRGDREALLTAIAQAAFVSGN